MKRKKKEEKEISLAKISFLKNGFFAAAFVMVMAVVVVLVGGFGGAS